MEATKITGNASVQIAIPGTPSLIGISTYETGHTRPEIIISYHKDPSVPNFGPLAEPDFALTLSDRGSPSCAMHSIADQLVHVSTLDQATVANAFREFLESLWKVAKPVDLSALKIPPT